MTFLNHIGHQKAFNDIVHVIIISANTDIKRPIAITNPIIGA